MGLCTTNVWIFTIIIGFFFPITRNNYGITSCFIFFLVASLIGLIFILKECKETKNKTQIEIWKELGVDMDLLKGDAGVEIDVIQ